MGQTITSKIKEHAETSPQKVFWRHLSGATVEEITFAGFYRRCLDFARYYESFGAGHGDVILVFLPHMPHITPAFFGAMFVGAVPSYMPCPSSKQHPSIYWPEHRELFKRIRLPLVLTDRAHRDQMQHNGLGKLCKAILIVEDLPEHPASSPIGCAISPDAPALLQHSSGTTSLKKGVVLTHEMILMQASSYSHRLAMSGVDNIVSWLPLYHDMGLIACTVIPLVLGQTVTSLSPFEWVARPQSLFDALELHQGAFCWLPNFAFEHLSRAVPAGYDGDLSRVRAFINCSEPCKPATFDRFVSRFGRNGITARQLQGCYAMAETVFAATQTPPGTAVTEVRAIPRVLYADGLVQDAMAGSPAIRIMSMGMPLPGVTVQIEAEGHPLPPNQLGEIVIECDFLFAGYHNAAGPTNERLRHGRYFTRDRGFMRDGAVYVVGRIDDLMIINGRNLHANEVEGMLNDIAGVKAGRGVAFGLFNDMAGSEELIVVVERDDLQQFGDQDISRAVRDIIYERTNIEVKSCRVVDPGWLIKTTSGKIGRIANREKYKLDLASHQHLPPPLPSRNEGTQAKAIEFVTGFFKLRPDQLSRDSTAADVDGWDSIAHTVLLLEIEKAFNVRFTESQIFSFHNVGELSDRVEQLVAAGAAAVPDRIVHSSDRASIVRMGGDEAPDVIIFAGHAKRFGGLATMEFSSVFAGSRLQQNAKYFVTDHCLDWYTSCFDEVATRLNQLSNRPKVLVGNSMGGHGALKFATVLSNVAGVLAFVPQRAAPPTAQANRGAKKGWTTDFATGPHYCIVFGAEADRDDAEHLVRRINKPSRQRIIKVSGEGHYLVVNLQSHGLLADIVSCAADPASMADQIDAIIKRYESETGQKDRSAVQ